MMCDSLVHVSLRLHSLPALRLPQLFFFFFPWLFLSQNFSAEAYASNTICWLNLALSRGAGKDSGLTAPIAAAFLPLTLLPQEGNRQPVPEKHCGVGKGSKSLSQPPKTEIYSVTPVLHFSQCSGFHFIGVGSLAAVNHHFWQESDALPEHLSTQLPRRTEERTQTPDCAPGSGTIPFPYLRRRRALCAMPFAGALHVAVTL